jgi:hypothetical protein
VVLSFVLGSRRGLCLVLAVLTGACSEDDARPSEPTWTLLGEDLDAGLMSVWGSSERDVWAVGADDGSGPLVVHWDGSQFARLDTGVAGDLWWVFGFEAGPVFMGGSGGTILRIDGDASTVMETPGTGTVFGLWGSSPDEMWAVGGAEGGADGAFAWRLQGERWALAPEFPAELAQNRVLWKVWGSGPDDVWSVGTSGVALHSTRGSFEAEDLGGGESLFTVHEAGGRFVAVGGSASGLLYENEGNGWQRVDDGTLPGLSGVHMTSNDDGLAVGRFGALVERNQGAWRETAGPDTNETLHAVWVDPRGGVWTAGGQLDVEPLTHGVLAYRGTNAPKGRVN